jgi:hypothetical protein
MAINVTLTYTDGDLSAIWDDGGVENLVSYEWFLYKDEVLYSTDFTGGNTLTVLDVPDGVYYLEVFGYVLDASEPSVSGVSSNTSAGTLYSITIVRVPSSSAGSVSINGTPVTTSVSFLAGASITAVATPTSNFDFVNFEVDSVEVSVLPSYSFSMPASNIVLTANFEEKAIPPVDPVSPAPVYDTNCPKFYLVQDLTDRFFAGEVVDLSTYTPIQVEEPIQFDSGAFKIERDADSHGFLYEFSVDNLEYEIGSVGYNTIKNSFYTFGTDSDLKLVYGFGDVSALTVFYVGKIDFNEYKEIEDGEKLAFGLREIDFDNLLQTAFDVEQTTTPDLDVLLYSKVIPKKVTYTVPQQDQIAVEGNTLANAFYSDNIIDESPFTSATVVTPYIFINDGREGDSVDIFTTYDFQVDGGDPISEGAGYKYLLRAKQAGKYKIDVTATLRLFVTYSTSSPFDYVVLSVARTTSDGQTLIGTINSQAGTLLNNSFFDPVIDIEFDKTYTFDLDLEECIYLYIQINTGGIPSGASIDSVALAPFRGASDQPQITVVAETLERASKAKAIAPLPLLESVISKSAETDYTTVVSDFFDDGGCGNKLSILNGFGVRGIDLEERSDIKVSPKNLVSALKDLFCLGWGVEYNFEKKELVRIEPVEYFYQDVEIMSFDRVSDYQKEVDSSKYYNEVEVGFSKYSKDREKDKGNTIDDFHTKHNYQTPIKTNKNKLSVLTDLTLSGYEIEILRRKQFEKNGEDENANFREDEDLFGVQLLNYTLYTGDTFTGILTDLSAGDIIRLDETTIIVAGYAYFYNGQLLDVNVDGQGAVRTSVLNISYKQFTPQGFAFTIAGTQIRFTTPINTAINITPSVVISTVAGESYYVPESSQAHSIATNLISPETAYNLRYTPKRILYNWAKLFNGGFFGKSATEEVVFRQGDGNVELTTQFSLDEDCLLGDINRDEIIETENVQIGDLYGRGFLYLPIKVSFSAPMSFEQLIELKNCLRGIDETKSYGYITVVSPCGDTEKIFLTSVEYNPVQDEVKMEGYLKEL